MRSIFRNMFVRICMLVLLAAFVIMFVSLHLKQNDLLQKAARLDGEIAQMHEIINELQAEIDRPFDDDYVAEIAREKLGLRYPQEIVFYSSDDN
ncbi:MAG: septum formation initiator family protein [Clostridia bacterium]|nr:septum formation initiator family protein [Clostridia bacterium]